MNTLSRLYYSLLSFLGLPPIRKKADMTPIAPFDLTRYVGKWYEIARFNHLFERNMTHVTALYTIQKDGTIRVENSGVRNDRRRSVIGKAKPSANRSPEVGALKVSFFWPFYAPYRVIMLSEDYSYALVTSGPRYLWILSRTPALSIPVVEKILAEAIDRGFDTKKLIFVPQG